MAHEIDIENGLVRLEDHPWVHLEVLIQIQPRAIGAWLPIAAVAEDPRALIRLVEADDGLVFTEEFVVDADFAVRRPPNDDIFIKLWLVEVDLSCGWTTKDLELQSNTIVVKVLFKALLHVDGLHLVLRGFMVFCLMIE